MGQTPDVAAIASSEFEALSKMPVFKGLQRKKPDVCLDGNCRYTNLSAAVGAAGEGATIVVAPGDYDGCITTGARSLAIVGLVGAGGARATFRTACAGKAAFVVSSAKFYLQGVRIEGIQVPDRNGACLRLGGATITQQVGLVDVECTDSENGILGNIGNGTLIVRGSLFARNGGNGGYAHGIYIDGGREVWIDDTTITHTKGLGHTLKIGAERLVVERSTLAALNGQNSRSIDFYGGGLLMVRGSVLQQGPRSDNHDAIALAMEPARRNEGVPHGVYVSQSWIIYDDPARCCRWAFKGEALGPVTVENTVFVGITASPLIYLDGGGNQSFSARAEAGLPAYDGTLSSLPRRGPAQPWQGAPPLR